MNEEMFPERLAVAVFELEGFVVPPGERVLLSGQYEAARDALSAAQLAVIEGIYVRGMRVAVIAEELGVSVYRVQQLKAQGLHVLRLALNGVYRGRREGYLGGR